MFSFFKKKKEEVELSSENFMHANPQDFGWDLVGENDVNTATIGSSEVCVDYKVEETPIPSVRGKRIVINDKKQESRILDIIRENGLGMTPPEVEEVYNNIYDAAPLTSIRRAMTKLTDHGYLNMTGEKRKGKYNKMNFVWSLKNPN
jgi:hypothetical protein